MYIMTENIKNLSKDFLRATTRGNLTKLKDLYYVNDIKDWTIFQHEISGDTALHIAAREGYLEVVKFLYDNWDYPKFKVDVANKDMKRPLHEAAQFARYEIVDFLINNGATVDALKRADWTPLMLACTKDSPDAVKCVNRLIKAGANLTLKNKDGWIPLHIASRTGNVEIIQVLLKEKPEAITLSSKNGRTALHIAAFHGHVDAVDLLISTESHLLDTKDFSGLLPIHEAIKSGNDQLFERLVALGVDLKKTDSFGHTILHIAASVGNIFVINYIVNNNIIEIDCRDNFGATALEIGRRNKIDNVIDYLQRYDKVQLK